MDSRKKSPVPPSLAAALSGGSLVTTNLPVAQRAVTAPSSDTGTVNPGAPAVEPNFLAHEVCQILKIGRTTLFKIVKSGELVPLHITARIRVFPLSTIKAFLASKGAE
ncbi:helix-turn-helix transcriptional regulator [Burkholderia pseudomallei]|uniref:helix-turn-helix transcriptional regulator n=1 Tax=Burkholderia pseudomallei TaxID=28450 RepID=UPI0022DB50B0|nr:helix-turn-helix domain-containing protein [Burkholderia pseudomallei]MDA0558487.1 helix-turn-helix domain-containing protein [Burkholderia pseudomallei]